MLQVWQKYGGFIHLVLKIMSVVLFWNAISNYTNAYWTFINMSRHFFGFLVTLGLALALFTEKKTYILTMFIVIQVYSLFLSATSLSQLFFWNVDIFWYQWVYTFIPIILTLVSLVGFALISKRSGSIIVMISGILSVIYNMVALVLLFNELPNGNYSFTLYNIFLAFIGLHFALLLMVFVYKQYYTHDAYQQKPNPADEIHFE